MTWKISLRGSTISGGFSIKEEAQEWLSDFKKNAKIEEDDGR